MRSLTTWLLVFALAGLPAAVAAPQEFSDTELNTGVQQVREGDFEAAVVTLEAAARRLSQDRARAKEAAQAWFYFGMAQLSLGQETPAKGRFREALHYDRDLSPTTRDFPPRVVNLFREVQQEMGITPKPAVEAAPPGATPAVAPAPAKKKGGGKALPILLGVGGAAAAAVALAGGKADPLTVDDDRDGLSENAGDCNDANPNVNPNGSQTFANARFETTLFDCPDGSVNARDPTTILIDAANNRCGNTVAISRADVVITVVAAFRTTNFVGEVFSGQENRPFSPSGVAAAGGTAIIRVDPDVVCTNSRGPSGGAFNEISGRVTLQTSAGPFTVQTVNRHRTNFP